MEMFYNTFGFVGAIVLGIVILAVFFKVVGNRSRETHSDQIGCSQDDRGDRMTVPNNRATLDAGRAICFHCWRHWPGASERGRS